MLSLFTAMAKDDNAWKRYRDREDEDAAAGSLTLHQKRTAGGSSSAPEQQATHSTDKLDRMMEQATVLMEQVGNLLKMYVQGIERLPPNEKRKLLDALIIQITAMSKPTQASQFRVSTLVASYSVYKDKWDRTLRDLESGKIVRRKGA